MKPGTRTPFRPGKRLFQSGETFMKLLSSLYWIRRGRCRWDRCKRICLWFRLDSSPDVEGEDQETFSPMVPTSPLFGLFTLLRHRWARKERNLGPPLVYLLPWPPLPVASAWLGPFTFRFRSVRI